MTDRWPFGNEDATTRARRVAQTYREALNLNNRVLCAKIDEVMAEYGETWINSRPVEVEPDGLDEVTTSEAAELVHVPEHRIRRWTVTDRKGQPGVKMLRPFGKRGRENTYLVRDVVSAAELAHGPVGLPAVDR